MKAEERLVERLRKFTNESDGESPVVQDLRGILFQYDVDRSIDAAQAARACRVSRLPPGRIFPQLAHPE